jgi:NAD(P)-dependent dehydrogenase (short-subunit alcohol dehydrogenase family)
MILVTGATDGIGKETALELQRRGESVIVHGRNKDKVWGEHTVVADLSDLDQVRAMAAELPRLKALVHNAGVYMRKRTMTNDGREMTMAVNHDAPVLLTHLVSAERIVCVSSIAHTRGRIDLDDIDMLTRWDPYSAYAASKLANVMFAVALSRRGVIANALHPGVVSTKLLKAGFGMEGPDSVKEGAETSVFLATSNDSVSGKYFVRCREAQHASFTQDFADKFYLASCKRVGVSPLPARDK